jgi:hypothetical protein
MSNKAIPRFKPRHDNVYELNKKQEDFLYDLYYNKHFTFGRDRLFQYIQSHWNNNNNNDHISRRAIQEWLIKQNIYQLFKPIRKTVQGNVARTLLNAPWNQLGIDLIDFSNKEYDGYKWILCAIDLFSKKAYCQPLKNKESSTVAKGMQKIFNRMVMLPKSIRSDRGSEFIGKEFKKLLDDNNVKQVLSAPHKPQSNGNVERFNAVIKRLIQQYTTYEDNQDWVSILQTLVNNYNETISATTKKTPNEIEKHYDAKLNKQVKENIEKSITPKKEFYNKYKIGDEVRISLQNEGFSKSAQTFSNETYYIRKIIKPRSKVYSTYYLLEDDEGNEINQKFYVPELQLIVDVKNKIKSPEKFIISKLIKPFYKKVNGKYEKYYELKFRGYKGIFEEPRNILIKDVVGLINDFEKKNNVKWLKTKVSYNK